MEERITCPSRVGQCGPWSREEGVDRWERGSRNWGWRQRFRSAMARWAYRLEQKGWKRLSRLVAKRYGCIAGGGTSWPDEFPMPRTCSFCGCAHPDDVLTLVKMGWELSCAKSYKYYLETPGYRAWADAMFGRGSWNEDGTKKPYDPPKHPSPVPPVKLYTDHLTPEQVKAINEAINSRKKTVSGEASPGSA